MQRTLPGPQRDRAEQAKGIVAERAGLDIEAAFSKMWQFARDHDLRVVDVAHGLVDGSLDVR